MKFRNLKKRVATFGVVSALSVLCLSYQNCSRPNFAVDEATKAKILGETPVFGNDRDPGTDPVVGGGRDPGTDPVVGTPPRDPGTDPVTGTPRDPGKDPSTNPRDPGKDISTPKTYLSVTFMCPMGVQNHGFYKSVLASGELKAVFVSTASWTSNSAKTVCEIANIKDQMKANRKVDITACMNKGGVQTSIYIVESTVTSNYEKYSLNQSYVLSGSTMMLSMMPVTLAYTEMNDKANQASCDTVGDPLVVQLANNGVPQPISLGSADNGVMFDLLGKKNNYKKVQTAWFTDTQSENYFLVLPDANGDVKGIDQLFGDNTLGPDKRFSKQGFDALAKYDENRDHVISIDDSVFLSLRLWKDSNLDGIVQADELFTLEEKGVAAIDIKIDREDRRYQRTDIYGNKTKYRSLVIMKDGQYGLVYDLWLRYNVK